MTRARGFAPPFVPVAPYRQTVGGRNGVNLIREMPTRGVLLTIRRFTEAFAYSFHRQPPVFQEVAF